MSCYKLTDQDGIEHSFSSTKEILDYVSQRPDLKRFLKYQRNSELKNRSITDPLREFQENLLRTTGSAFSFVSTKDEYFFSSGTKFNTFDIDSLDPKLLDAPTAALHREGQEFINSIEFKEGTRVYYVYSSKTPYNSGLPNTIGAFRTFAKFIKDQRANLENRKLSAVVFVDNNGKVLDEVISNDKDLLQQKLKNKEAHIKYVGSYYEYSNNKDRNSDVIQNIIQRATEYKRKLGIGQNNELTTQHDVLLFDPEISETVTNIIGFNKKIAVNKKNTKDSKENNGGKILQSLGKMKWLKDKLPVLGIVRMREGQPYIQLNDGQIIVDPSIVYRHNLGDPVLFVPSNVNLSSVSVKKGNTNYFPVRIMQTTWRNNPIFSTIFINTLRKIIDKKISYDVELVRDRLSIKNVVDNTEVSYSNSKEEFKKYWRNQIIKQAAGYVGIYNNFKKWAVEENKELNEENLNTYLEDNNVKFKGQVYSSLVKDTPVNFFEHINEFMGLAKFTRQDSYNLLRGFLSYQEKYNQKPYDIGDVLQEFFNDDTILNGTRPGDLRSQVDVDYISNYNYFKNYIYHYGVLVTDLDENRPTSSASFFTSPKVKQEEQLPDIELEIDDPWRNSEVLEAGNLTREDVKAWAETHFPNFPIEFVTELIDGIATGRANLANDLVSFVDSFLTTGLIKEEFGHMAFKYLSTQERLRVLTAAAEESGMPLTPANRVALEEYVMSKLRNDPRELPVGALQRFISWVRELFSTLFRNRTPIETFIDRFHRGEYKNVGKAMKEGKGYRYSHSPLYLALNLKQKNYIKYIINKNFLPQILEGSNLLEKIYALKLEKKLKGDSEYTDVQAISDVYDNIKSYIKGLKAKSPPEVQQKYDNLLKVLEEPAMIYDLYKDLENSHGIKIEYTLEESEDAAEDGLDIVKKSDVAVIDRLGKNIRMLLSNIPDVISITGDVQPLLVNTFNGVIKRVTDTRFLQNVVYNTIGEYSNKNFKLFTFEHTLQSKIDGLLLNISGSKDIETMLSKLETFSQQEPWVKVLLFKLKEEKALGKNTLLNELFNSIGQLIFTEHSYLESRVKEEKEDDGRRIVKINSSVRSLNVKDIVGTVYSKLLNSIDSFNYRDGHLLSHEELLVVIKNIKTRIARVTNNKETFLREVPKIFEDMGLFIEKEYFSNMLKGFAENKDKVVRFETAFPGFMSVLNSLANHLGEINSTKTLGYDTLIATSKSVQLLTKLAEMIASGSPKQRLQTFRDNHGKPRQSYKNPNFLLKNFVNLWKDPAVLARYRNFLGYRFNPLLTAFDDIKGTGSVNLFDLKIFSGKAGLSFGEMNNTQRLMSMLHLFDVRVRGADNKYYDVGHFWIGNLSDSETAYTLQAPVLSKSEIISNLYRLRLADLDYMFCGAQIDSNFKKNLLKGFTYPGINELVFGKPFPTQEDLEIKNYSKFKEIFTNKEVEISNIIAATLKAEYEKLKEEKLDFILNPVNAESLEIADNISQQRVENWFYNQNYYMETALYAFMGHPYFSKDMTDLFKRSKQWHTDGVINSNRKPLKFIQLRDNIISSSKEFLAALENLPDYIKDIAIKSYSVIKASDSQAYGSISMLRNRAGENKSWSDLDEQMYQAELALDVAEIQRLAPLVNWGPLKLGVYGHEVVKGAFSEFTQENFVIPTIQKYGFFWVLPSHAYRTKNGELIRPDDLEKKSGLSKSQVYKEYLFPELAKICFEQFKPHSEDGVDYVYYTSGAKWGNYKEWDLESEPEVRLLAGDDMKVVTDQPNKNNLDFRPLGVQSIFQILGQIKDDYSYDLGPISEALRDKYGDTISGKDLRPLLEDLFIREIEENIQSIDFYKNGDISPKDLSVFLLSKLQNSQWNTTETSKALDLNESNTNFRVRPYSSSMQETIFRMVNYAIEDVMKIRVASPSYKNVASSGGLKTRIKKDSSGNYYLESDIRVAMWPELAAYRDNKLNASGRIDQATLDEVNKEILQELRDIEFTSTYYRIPTEGPYSYIRFNIVDFLPTHAGHAIEVGDSFTTQTGGDFDGDAIFGIISRLRYRNKLSLIPGDVETKEGRQTLLSRIYSQVMKSMGLDMAVPGEHNRLDELAKSVKLPSFRFGSLDSNLFYQELNDVGSDAISTDAVIMTVETYLKGYFNTGDIHFLKPVPSFTSHNDSITTWVMDNGESKLEHLYNNTAAAVNMPKDATLTRLGLNKELNDVKSVMTNLGVPFDYSIKFLNAPVIKDFIKKRDEITLLHSGSSYWFQYNSLLAEYGIDRNSLSEANNRLIPIENLYDSRNEADVLIKFLQIKDRASEHAKLTAAIVKLTRPQKPDVGESRMLLKSLRELRDSFSNMDELLPLVEYKNENFSLSSVPSNKLMNKYGEIQILKLKLLNAVSTYFKPFFTKAVVSFEQGLIKINKDNFAKLNDLFLRYTRSKQIKPIHELMHLGAYPIMQNGVPLYFPGSLGYIKNKAFDLKRNSTVANKELDKIIFTLSQIEYIQKDKGGEIFYVENGRVGVTRDIKLIPGIYQDQIFIEQFEQGLMAMYQSSDPDFYNFAKDLRDYSVYKGYSRKGGNIGALIPATLWEDMEDSNDENMKRVDTEKFVMNAVQNFPEEFSVNVKYGSIKGAYDKYNATSNQKPIILELSNPNGFLMPNSIFQGKNPKFININYGKELHLFALLKDGRYVEIPIKGTGTLQDFRDDGITVANRNKTRGFKLLEDEDYIKKIESLNLQNLTETEEQKRKDCYGE